MAYDWSGGKTRRLRLYKAAVTVFAVTAAAALVIFYLRLNGFG